MRCGSQTALMRLSELEPKRLYGIALRIARRPEIAADVLHERITNSAMDGSPRHGEVLPNGPYAIPFGETAASPTVSQA